MRKRKGFTMIEMIASTVMLALIATAVVASSNAINTVKVNTRNTVFLSIHNLNCMERLRQECLQDGNAMLLYYDDDYLGSDAIETYAYLERSTWDKWNIYSVRIESRVRETGQRLTSEYVITDIGGVSYSVQINPE